MRRFVTALGIAMIGAAAAGAASAQSSPPIGDTIGFIRDRVAEQGQLNYTGTTHDANTNQTWNNQFQVQATNFAADPAACMLRFHWRAVVDGKVASDMDTWIDFRIVSDVQLHSMADDTNRVSAESGHANWSTTVQPAVWALILRNTGGGYNTLDFRDENAAQRVVKAVEHAAGLCGGPAGKPF